ncbi:hypothetical protein DY000_02020901 [Brassica cretica]|uniref:Uncharacterized protein n=1 Tax=Brassica cretica TaxID=69181 RepID=A0ABQ7ELH0_BRACR|nr:hypothetical protein DY000_02020901 [Brassica cretica]
MLEGKKNTNAIPVSEYEKLIVASDEPGDGLLASPSISSSVASSSSSSGMIYDFLRISSSSLLLLRQTRMNVFHPEGLVLVQVQAQARVFSQRIAVATT